MSDSANKKRRAGADETQYFVRVRDGAVFGPVPLSELAEWAESGNTMPGDEISTDKEHWGLAMNLPELRMNVMIDRGDSSFQGPFNEKAIEPLIQNGAIPAGARRMGFEEFAPACRDGCAPPDSGIRDELRAEMEERLESAAQQARDAIAERDREIETLADTRAAKDELLAEKEKELLAEKEKKATKEDDTRTKELENEFAELLGFANSRDAEYAAKIEKLEKNESVLSGLLKEKDKALAKWQSANASLNHRVKELEKGAGLLFN